MSSPIGRWDLNGPVSADNGQAGSPTGISPRRADRSLHDVVALARTGSWHGIRRVRPPIAHRSRVNLADMMRRLEDVGYLPVRPAALANPSTFARIAHRHLAIVTSRASERAAAMQLVLRATQQSPRGHLLVDVSPRQALWGIAREKTCSVSALLARARQLGSECRFDSADAILSGVEAWFWLQRKSPPCDVVEQRFVVDFWQGRWDACRQWVACGHRPRSADQELLVPMALLAWWQLQEGEIRALLRHVADLEPGEAQGAARRLLRLMLVALRPPHPTVRDECARLVDGLGRTRVTPADWLMRVAAADVCLAAGWSSAVLTLVDQPTHEARASARDQLLARWVVATVHEDQGTQARLLAVVHRCGAHAIKRLGSRSPTMPWLHTLPVLLRAVNEAEDDLAALQGGCRWLTHDCSAEAGAFLDASDGSFIAGTAQARLSFSDAERVAAITITGPQVTPRPDGVVIAAPVRYAGCLIGVALACGPADRAAALTDALLSLAALCGPALRTRLDTLALRRQSHTQTPEILGCSPAMTALREAIARAAASPFPVLIEGESGSGKELVARAIHRLSSRRDRRFAALNCAALSDELAESELFGHTRGAFTGALGARQGMFEEAHSGTLFLDEVAELSLRAQAKLLRALQEREIRRVGENAPRPVDVRVVAATNRSLRSMVAGSEFREDLLFRLAVVKLKVPPLRDRPEDVPLLVHTCWRRATQETSTRATIGPDALRQLVRHHWPGNVRELQNVTAALAVLAPTRGRVSARHVDHVLAESDGGAEIAPASLDGARAACERRTVSAALARHAGRRTAAAHELGLSRQGLAKAIKRLQLEGSPPVEGVA
ncbi:MAG: sigma 54-interacting transcriptional regulator [Vicinamibacterales bacterium]